MEKDYNAFFFVGDPNSVPARMEIVSFDFSTHYAPRVIMRIPEDGSIINAPLIKTVLMKTGGKK